MNFVRITIGLSLAVATAIPATAANNAVPSCYKNYPAIGLIPAAPVRETFVFVDQTTPISEEMKASLQESLSALIGPGSAFTVASFSEAAPGRFPVIITSGVIEAGVPPQQRGDISVPKLKQFDSCLIQQAAFGAREATKGVFSTLSGATGSFAHSEVMASLQQLSRRVAASPARDRIVILVSDMLEHSSTTSFYEKQTIRLLNPAEELAKIKKADLLGDFHSARVYVVGAGSIPTKGIRPHAQMTALEAFWRKWFAASNARVAEFGAPNLLTPIPQK